MSKDNTKSVKTDIYDNQDILKYSEIMGMGGIKHSWIMVKLYDYNKYVLDNTGDIFQDKLLKCCR